MGILNLFKKDASSKLQINWRNSKAHLLLLSKYLRANSFESFAQHDYWKAMWDKVLGESAKKAIKRFVNEGMIVPPEVKDLVSYKYKVTELKEMLRERSLPVSGRKEKLVEILMQEDPEGMKKHLAGLSLFICSQSGREIAEQYLEAEKEKRAEVEKQAMELLSAHMFKELSQLVSDYETDEVFPSGFVIGIETEQNTVNPNSYVEMLKTIFSSELPEILSVIDNNSVETVRITAAMMGLFGTTRAKKWIPDGSRTGMNYNLEIAARMLSSYVGYKGKIAQYQRSGIKYAEVLPAPDSCESCKKLEGIKYPLDKVPELPNANCTHEMGCRCTCLPVVDLRS